MGSRGLRGVSCVSCVSWVESNTCLEMSRDKHTWMTLAQTDFAKFSSATSPPQVGKAWLALARLCQHSAASLQPQSSPHRTDVTDDDTATAAAAAAAAAASRARFCQLALTALRRAQSVQRKCASPSSTPGAGAGVSAACSDAFSYLEGRLAGDGAQAPAVV